MRWNEIKHDWTLETAQDFVNKINKYFPPDIKLDIVGSVSRNGYSNNDLDIAIQGIQPEEIVATVESALKSMGFTDLSGPHERAHHDDWWFMNGQDGDRAVEIYFNLDL